MNSRNVTHSDKKTLTDLLRVRAAFIIDPIVSILARFRISPNLFTVVGMLAHFLIAWFIVQGQMVAAGVAILFVAPLDALDGALARKLGRKPGFGAFLDSTLDRLAEIILFGGFIFYFSQSENMLLVATVYIALTGSLMVSYARSRAEALDVSCKVGLLTRVERYAVLTFFLLLNRPAIALVVVAVLTYITVAQRIFHVWQQLAHE